MKEFSSISVPAYESSSLADQLTELSAAGWDLVAVLPAGVNIVALVSRDAAGSNRSADVPEIAVAGTAAVADAFDPGAADFGSTTTYGESETVDTDVTTSLATTVMAATETETATGSTASATSGAAPAGWYPDPAGRYELRYWDGSQWTEHVSRAGQQYTDPPVA